jgi:lipopolysaccharide/colanic/teichoic acid biosynthesis glycosyltransferase
MRLFKGSIALSAKNDAIGGFGDGPDTGLASLIADIHRSFDRRWSRRVAVDVVCAIDALLIVLAALVPALIYAQVYLAKAAPFIKEPTTPWLAIVQTGLIAAMIACGALRHWGMYDSERVHDLPTSPACLLGGLSIAAIAVLGLGNPFSTAHPMLWIWSAAWLSASFTLLLGNRIVARALLRRWTAAGRFETRVAVFGAGTIARRVRDHLANPALGLRFVGVYDDRIEDGRVNPEGLSVTGRLDTLIKAARMGRVDRIVVALPQSADHRQTAVLRKLEALPVSIHMVTHIASDLVAVGSGYRVSNLGPVGLLDVKERPLADWAPLLKLIEDYALGFLFLVFSLPLMAVIAIGTKLNGSGSVLVSERRRGLDARVFQVWRFRTDAMAAIVSPATADAAGVAEPSDPQTSPTSSTRFAQILRSSGLEKLPQLFNVLRGDMSLVGPAPYDLSPSCRYGQMLEDHANRYRVKPGIIGSTMPSATVSAASAGTSVGTEVPEQLRARIQSEMADISHWSLGRDVHRLALAIFRRHQ